MNDAEVTTLALKTIDLRTQIQLEKKWRQRYLLRSIVVKTLFDKRVTFADLESGIKEILKE